MSQAAREMHVISFEQKPEKTQSLGDGIREQRDATKLTAENNMSREITREMSKTLQEELFKRAIELGKEHKVYASYVLETFDDNAIFQQDITIKFSAAHPLGFDRFALDLIQGKGARFKFKPEHYGLLFVKSGVEHVLKGIDINEGQVILGTPTASIVAPAQEVYRWLKGKGVIS